MKFKDKNTHNVNVLALYFPEVYMRNITKILYNKYCVDCNILPHSSLANRNWNYYVGYSVQTVPSIFIVFGKFFSSFYTFSTGTNNYSM